jgi:hypothetical protein
MTTPKELIKKYTESIMTEDGWGRGTESLIRPQEAIKMLEEYKKDLLTDFLEFLLKEGYVDSDVYSEPPTAIDKYLHPELR